MSATRLPAARREGQTRRARCVPRPALLVVLLLATVGCGRGTTTKPGPDGAASGFSRYVSSADGLTGRLASDYHPFWFDYPSGCEVVPHGPETPQNYVSIRRHTGSGDGREMVEELNVGYVWVDLPGETVSSKMSELTADIKESLGGAVTSEGRRDINGRSAYELRIRQQSAGGGRRLIRPQQVIPRPGRAPLIIPAVYAPSGPATPGQVYTLRIVILPAPDNRPSGLLLMAVTRGDSDGKLAAAIDSFRFGKP